MTRRNFLVEVLGVDGSARAAAGGALLVAGAAWILGGSGGPDLVRGAEANSRINIGLVGCGGRGKWIAELFKKHGGYNVAAVADYFVDRTNEAGE